MDRPVRQRVDPLPSPATGRSLSQHRARPPVCLLLLTDVRRACIAQRTMADPEPKPGSDSGTSDKTIMRTTRGAGKAAAPAAEQSRTRHGGRAMPDKKAARGRASADRTSGAAEAPDGPSAAEEPRMGKAKGRKAAASPADRASMSVEAPDAPLAQDEKPTEGGEAEEASEPSTHEAPQAADAAEAGVSAADPSSAAYLRAQVRTEQRLCWVNGRTVTAGRYFSSTCRSGCTMFDSAVTLQSAVFRRKRWRRRLRQIQRMRTLQIQCR